jgi:hypothetical protein
MSLTSEVAFLEAQIVRSRNYISVKHQSSTRMASYSIFISYCRSDARLYATELKQRLEAYGLEVWMDVYVVRPGDNFPKVMGDAIAKCTTMILLWSHNAPKSHFVEMEWNTAMALKKTILPVSLAYQIEVPAALTAIQWLEGKDLSTVVTSIISSLPMTNSEEGLQRIRNTPSSFPKKKKWLVTMMVFLLTISGCMVALQLDFSYRAQNARRPDHKLLIAAKPKSQLACPNTQELELPETKMELMEPLEGRALDFRNPPDAIILRNAQIQISIGIWKDTTWINKDGNFKYNIPRSIPEPISLRFDIPDSNVYYHKLLLIRDLRKNNPYPFYFKSI